MSSKNDNEINWDEVLGKEALGNNGLDIGTIKEISDEYVVTMVGMINKKIYHLPKTSVKYFNGVFLNFSLNESDLLTYEQKIKDSTFDDSSFNGSLDKPADDAMSIPLISEDLQVTKSITEDNIKIIKEPIRETKTVEIELMREKVTIERRDVTNNDDANYNETRFNLNNKKTSNQGSYNKPASDAPAYLKTEFSIPIKRQEPLIKKKPFVREELIIKKKPVTETKTIAEEVTREEVKYDNKIIE